MRGRAWARAAFTVGITTSIACNVGHTFVGGNPKAGAVAMSAFWPVAVFLAIEVIARVEWPDGKGWAWVRYGGLSTVAAIAAILSYEHMAGLMRSYGEGSFSAAIAPLAIDGLMVVATAALLALGRAGRPVEVVQAVPEVASAVVPSESVTEALAEPEPTPELEAPATSQAEARRRNKEARRAYRASVKRGTPLTGKELGEKYGMSDRWGRWIAQTAQ